MRRWLYFESVPLFTDLVWGVEWRTGRDVRYDVVSQSNILTIIGSISNSQTGVLDSVATGGMNQTNYLEYPTAGATDPRSNERTTFTMAVLSRHISPQNVSVVDVIYAKEQYASAFTRGMIIYVAGSNGSLTLNYEQYTTNITNSTIISTPIVANQWNLSFFDYNAATTQSRLFLNNNQSPSSRTFPSTPNAPNNIPFQIGAVKSGPNFVEPYTFRGAIQYIYRWNRLLTQDERNYLHNGGNFRFLA